MYFCKLQTLLVAINTLLVQFQVFEHSSLQK